MRVSFQLVIDCASPDTLSHFWAEGPSIWFQVVPERKSIKNRFHIDVNAGGGREHPIAVRRERVEAEAGRLESLGATRLRVMEEEGLDHYAVAMADPEGNEFDVH